MVFSPVGPGKPSFSNRGRQGSANATAVRESATESEEEKSRGEQQLGRGEHVEKKMVVGI